MDRIYIDRYTGKITRADMYLVNITLKDGTVIENLEPRRLFPLSNQSMYISLLDKNEHEVCFVRDLKELDKESAAVLEACFTEYYRIPQITKLLEITEKFGAISWRVDTNLGVVKFRIRNRHSDIKNLSGNRILVRDTNDNRYEIPDWTTLDAHSRHLLFPYL